MTAMSKNVYCDILNDIINKYNNTFHTTIKMKPTDVKSDLICNIMLILMRKILSHQNLKQVIM